MRWLISAMVGVVGAAIATLLFGDMSEKKAFVALFGGGGYYLAYYLLGLLDEDETNEKKREVKTSDSKKYRLCNHCKSEVPKDATVCKFCARDMEPLKNPSLVHPPPIIEPYAPNAAVSPPPPPIPGQLIHVKRKGEAEKVYPLDQARQLYNDGFLRPTDWAWQKGMAEWKSIADVLSGR